MNAMDSLHVKIQYGGILNVDFSGHSPIGSSLWNEKRHCNAEYELHFILGGSCRLFSGRESDLLTAGTMTLITPGIYHSSESDDPELIRFSVSLSPGDRAAQKHLRSLDSDRIRIFAISGSTEALCREFLSEARRKEKANRDILTSLLTVIAVHSFRMLGLPCGSSSPSGPDEREIRNGIIDTFFQTQYAQAGGEELLAAQLGLSKRQLVRVLYENYGQSFREKQTAARMDQAAVLLREGRLSISEIGMTVGYTSETAFFKQFRNYYQQTPGQYRCSYRSSGSQKP